MSAASPLKDKVPPHNTAAEQAVLGALLLDADAVTAVAQFLRADDFYLLQNQKIYEAIVNLFNKSQRPDLITLTDELKRLKELDAAGGPGYIAGLTDTVPTSANVEYYAKIVRENSLRRKLIKAANSIIAYSHDETNDASAILENAQKEIFEVTETNQSMEYKSIRAILPETIDSIEKLYSTKQPFTGISSGFEDLDNLTCGFQPSELTIIGARPSIGKTAFALSMAANIAVKQKKPTGFFSLEMADQLLLKRLLSMEAQIPSEKLRTGMLSHAHLQSLIDISGKIYDSPFYVVDFPNMRLLDLRTTARRLRIQEKIEILFIDYIGLITNENSLIPRHEQVAEISRSLKGLARELNIPIIVLSQVRRDSEGQKPALSDLRESGSLEQDADVVLFLHRDRETNRADRIETDLIIAKQRNGPLGTIKLDFLPSFTKFETHRK